MSAPAQEQEPGMSRPLSGVEELLWLLDAPGEPQTLRLELALPNALDPEQVRRAAQRVMAVHPLARARMAPWNAETRVLSWSLPATPDDDPVLVTDDDAAVESLVSRPLSVDRAPGWRLALLPGRLVLVANHALFDLGSGIRLLSDLAAAYRDAEAELARDAHPPAAAPPRPGLRERVRVAAPLAARMLRPAAPLASVPTGGATGYLVSERLVDQAELDHRRHADVARADLLVASGHRAVAAFNAECGQPSDRIVLLTAIGTPRAQLVPRPVENAWVATSNVTRAADRGDDRRLLELVAAQRRRAREHDAPALAAALETASAAPVYAKRLLAAMHPLTGHRLEETAALTYLGEVDACDFGAAGRSTALVVDGPARAPKGLFIGAVVHERTLCIGYRGNAAQLDRPALERLADAHVAALLALGGTEHAVVAR